MNPPVILLHGLRHTRLSMVRMQRFFKSAGSEVFNLGYPSGRAPLDKLAELVLGRIRERYQGQIPLDFVTHSMGSILLRWIAKDQPGWVRRAVMLAPPNHGSELVDRLVHLGPARAVMGPAGRQLGIAGNSIPNRLGPVDFCLGVIAGSRPDNPFSRFFVPGPEDGRVSVASTRVDGMVEQLVVPYGHFFLMQKADVIRQAFHFLEHGHFAR